MGLQGMINDLVQQSDFPTGDKLTDELDQLEEKIKRNRQEFQQLKIFRMLQQNFGGYPKKRIKQHNSVLELQELVAQENHLGR
jgi:hypothetical protein